MSERTKKVQWSGLIIGILFILISVFAFMYPLENFMSLTWVVGLFIVINGILEISYRRLEKKLFGVSSGWILALGILNIIFGIVVMLNLAASSIVFIYLFAVWFIMSACLSLFTITPAIYSRGFRIISIILNIIFILAGVVLLFNPLLGAVAVSFTIAFAFLISGIFYVIDAFD